MEDTYFNIEEVLKIANNIEEEGEKFYTLVARKTENADVKKVFSRLAEEEQEHQNEFERMLAVDNKEIFDFETDNLLGQYLKEIIEDKVFPEDDDSFKITEESVGTAVDIAIQAEIKAAEFYDKAAGACVNPEGRDAFNKLKCIEQEHLRQLRELKLLLT